MSVEEFLKHLKTQTGYLVDGIDAAKFLDDLEVNSSWERFLFRDMTQYLSDRLEKIRDKKTGKVKDHTKIVIYGESGQGKSYSALTISKTLYNNFSVENNVFWDLFDVYDSLDKIEAGGVALVDEKKTLHGVGSRTIAQDFQDLAETCRDIPLSLLLLANSRWEVEAHIYLKAIPGFLDIDDGYVRLALVRSDYERCLGFVSIQNPIKKGVDVALYEKLKEERGKLRSGKGVGNRYEDKIAKMLDMKTPNGETYKEFLRSVGGKITKDMSLEVIDMAYPAYNRNVTAKTLAKKLKYMIDYGFIKL